MIFFTKLLSLLKPKPKLTILEIACKEVAAKKLISGSRGLEKKELDDFFQRKGVPKLTAKESEEMLELFREAYRKSESK